MHWAAVVRRLRALLARRTVEQEMREELELHLELERRALEHEGLAPEAARRVAMHHFGGVEVVKEAVRDARGTRPMEDLIQDIRYAVRALHRRPLVTAVAILTIALGVGAATALYSIVDGVLLRPLPFREPTRLVEVWRTRPDWRNDPSLAAVWNHIPLSMPDYRDLQEKGAAFESVAIWVPVRETLVEGDQSERVPTIRTSSGMLDVLGVHPERGRMFLPADDHPGAAGVAMISHEMWQRHYGGDPSILGHTIHFENRSYTIIGILPPGLTIGRTVPDPLGIPAFWIPVGQSDADVYNGRDNHAYPAIARLKPGTTMQRAEAQAGAILRDPANPIAMGTHLAEWQRAQTRDVRAPLLLLLAGAGLLLLIACVNVATILLGEAASREQEMAARSALGASRMRLTRQLLTESVTLTAGGGALGVAAAWAGTRVLVAFAPPGIPGLAEVALDARVIAVAVLVVAATGICCGLVPALALSRTGPAALLRVGTGQSARGRGALQQAMVAAELALSVVLLVGAGLLSRSFQNITAVDPGFRADHLVYINSVLPTAVAYDSVSVHRIYDDAAARLAALPGVAGVVVGTYPPFKSSSHGRFFTIEGEPNAAAPASGAGYTAMGQKRHLAQWSVVAPGYFKLLGIPLIAGRAFTEDDRSGSPPVVVVSATLARRDFPTGSPIGKRVRYLREWHTIVGVVGDVLYDKLTADVEPAMYEPFAQAAVASPTLIVRTSGLAPNTTLLRRALAEADPRLTLTDVFSIEELMRRSFAADRYRTMLMSLFGVLAALLSAVGLYGVTARAVARRTREVGIRLALGATAPSVVRHMFRRTLTGATAGIIAGLGIALVAARLLSPFLFGITPADPATYCGIVALLAMVAGLASWIPARRMSRLDVATVLRVE